MRQHFFLASVLLALALPARPITIWLAGDSTMAQKQPDKRPETGWGEALQPCFDSSAVRVANRATSPDDYRRHLLRFVHDVRSRGGRPVLFTPVVRRRFEGTHLVDTHGAYPDAARAAATEGHVPLVDMTGASAALIEPLGPDSSRTLWLHLDPGANPNHPTGVHDDTHFNPLGAQRMAGLAIDAIRMLHLDLAAQLRSCPAKP